MLQEEIIEGNILIINFLGGKIKEDWAIIETNTNGSEALNQFKYIFPTWVINECYLKDLKYHIDPLWTIPVINIIGQLGFSFQVYSNTSVKIIDYSTNIIITCIKNDNYMKYYPKDCTYEESVKDTQMMLFKAIIEFIKYYNKD